MSILFYSVMETRMWAKNLKNKKQKNKAAKQKARIEGLKHED